MRAVNSSDIFYTPGPVPSDPEQMRRYLEDEFLKLQKVVEALAAGHIPMSYAAPAKPRRGDFRIADGVSWNPGSGKGWYWYDGSSWLKL